MPLHYVRKLTVVSLLVYTNTYGSDMYYNKPEIGYFYLKFETSIKIERKKLK